MRHIFVTISVLPITVRRCLAMQLTKKNAKNADSALKTVRLIVFQGIRRHLMLSMKRIVSNAEPVWRNVSLVRLLVPNKPNNMKLPYWMDKLRGVKHFGVAYINN